MHLGVLHVDLLKQLLNEKGIKFNEIDIEKEGISRQDLEKLTGGSTVINMY